jgi:DNA-binding LacI/PurR family transcriptional regulator
MSPSDLPMSTEMTHREERTTAAELTERLAAEEGSHAPSGEHQHGYCIALVFTHPNNTDEGHAFFGPLVRATRVRAVARGCDVLILAPSADHWLEAELVERGVERGASGLIVFGGADGNPDILRDRWPELPVVFVERGDPVGTRSAAVGLDNEHAMDEVVLHLAQLGHSRIAHIAGLLDSRVGAERLAAYRTTLQRIGYTVRPDYIQSSDFGTASAYAATQRLLALDEPPDAIACAADTAALGAIKAIEDAGLRCPEDIAVTGFDDAEWAQDLVPALTTVAQPTKEMGTKAVDALIAMIEDPQLPPPEVLLPGTLIVRDSCGAGLAVA